MMSAVYLQCMLIYISSQTIDSVTLKQILISVLLTGETNVTFCDYTDITNHNSYCLNNQKT